MLCVLIFMFYWLYVRFILAAIGVLNHNNTYFNNTHTVQVHSFCVTAFSLWYLFRFVTYSKYQNESKSTNFILHFTRP